jgi:uncharacterized damage-inducible protein DinB
MTENILAKLFEHNHWANLQLIQVCSILSDEQLDAESQSATKGSIRLTLWHLIETQQLYLYQLTRVEPRSDSEAPNDFVELLESEKMSGEGLVALARDETSLFLQTNIQDDGFSIEPWVVMVGAIAHAAEHREQIKSMLSALGVTPPRLDGGAYGMLVNAVNHTST